MGSEAELEKEKEKADLRQRFMSMVLRGAAVIFVPFAAQVPAVSARVEGVTGIRLLSVSIGNV